MKRYLSVVIAGSLNALTYSGQAYAQKDLTNEENITAIVEQQVAAYNKRDIDAFVATYHDDVEIHYFPGGIAYSGKEKLKKTYTQLFNRVTCLSAKISNREIQGRFVVDTEVIEFCLMRDGEEYKSNYKAIATYEVVDGLIKRVLFLKEK